MLRKAAANPQPRPEQTLGQTKIKLSGRRIRPRLSGRQHHKSEIDRKRRPFRVGLMLRPGPGYLSAHLRSLVALRPQSRKRRTAPQRKGPPETHGQDCAILCQGLSPTPRRQCTEAQRLHNREIQDRSAAAGIEQRPCGSTTSSLPCSKLLKNRPCGATAPRVPGFFTAWRTE